MRIFRPRLWIHVLLVIAMLALFVTGCDEDTDTEEDTPTPTATEVATDTPGPTEEAVYPDEPPPLPPSFGIDFDAFGESEEESFLPNYDGYTIQLASYNPRGGALPIKQAAWGDQTYWNHAVWNVGLWSLFIGAGLIVPVAAFAAITHTDIPEQQPNGSWIWSNSFNAQGKLHTAELHGIYIPEGVRWEMYVSKEGVYTDFLWYYGQSDLPATEGYWILRSEPTDPSDLLRIDWTRNIAESTGTIKYTNIVPDGPENGGYIHTETNSESPYNAKWDIYNKGQDNHTLIEWHRTTQDGRVQDFKHFADNNWHCWDSDHKNAECP